MIRKIIVIALIISSLSSCISHKNILNFQGEFDENASIDQMNKELYSLRVDDIIYVDIKSSDDKLVSIFKTYSGIQNYNQLNIENIYYSGYIIDKQGFIDLPYLNKINVLGYTTLEVAQKIENELSKYIKEEVFVNVRLAGFKYVILGEVNSTGTKIMYQNAVNIVEAVANAGDITFLGDKKNVQIIRKTTDGTKRVVVDFTSIDIFNSESFYLQPNDIIYVPPLKQKVYGTGSTGTQTLATIISALSLITTTILLIKNLK